MQRRLTVADYMTRAPHAIGINQTLAEAAAMMRQHGIRHIPVLDQGVLRGIVSDRDVAVVNALDGADASTVRVDEAMSIEPYMVSDRAPLARAAQAMTAHKYDCAVIMEGVHVIGILTTTDALRALVDVLAERAIPEDTMEPEHVRSVVMAEHVHLRHLLSEAEGAAERILKGGGYSDADEHGMRKQVRELCTAMTAHLELENRVLVPVVRQVDAFGLVRGEAMLKEHSEQREALDGILAQVNENKEPIAAVAAAVVRLVEDMRTDMEQEEEALNGDLIRDDMISSDVEAG